MKTGMPNIRYTCRRICDLTHMALHPTTLHGFIITKEDDELHGEGGYIATSQYSVPPHIETGPRGIRSVDYQSPH